jgi:hypothetical protein
MVQIWVKVENRNEESTHLWDSNRFMSRYYGMQEIYHNYLENGEDRQSLASMEVKRRGDEMKAIDLSSLFSIH